MSLSHLPFLKPKGWPTLRKYSGESRYGFSEDDELIEHALDELIQAIESKDHSKLTHAIKALVECVLAKESGESDALDTQQETSGI